MKHQWGGIHILVVEDDQALNSALASFMRRTGATVFTAENGQEAVAHLTANRIDFVISDVQMPVMDGIELLKRIRANHAEIPIVLLATGHSQLDENSALASGAAGLIHKPFKLKALTDKMNELLTTIWPTA